VVTVWRWIGRLHPIVAFAAMAASAALAFVKEDEAAIALIIISAVLVLTLFWEGLNAHRRWKQDPNRVYGPPDGKRRVLAHFTTVYHAKR